MTVRLGFVGVGSMGQCAHLRNYVEVKGCQVVAIAELRSELAKKIAARYGVPRVYPDHERMLGAEKLDGIVASQPFSLHGVLVPELLKAGIPVFTEKPIANTVEAGAKIVKAVRKSGTWMMIGYHKRNDPATIYAKGEIDRLKKTGELGAMTYVRITMPPGDWIAGGFNCLLGSDEKYPELPRVERPRGMTEAAYKKYWTFTNYYIHQVNLMRHLLGEPYKAVYVDKADKILSVQSVGGVSGVIEMSPYQTTRGWEESALVCFERGYVKLDLPAPLAHNRPGRVEIFRDPSKNKTPERIVPVLPWVHAMKQQAVNFVESIEGTDKPKCGPEEALEDLTIARDYLKLWLANNRRGA
jgi:predicted dehydrogenase